MAYTAEDIEAEIRLLEGACDAISLMSGSPGTSALRRCSEMMLNATQSLLSGEVDIAGLFKYGDANGDEEFRQQLSKFLTQEYGDVVISENLMVTAGATQGLHLILSLLCDKSCPVFTEDPTYFSGYRIIRDDMQMNLVPVQCDDEGLDVNSFEQLIKLHKARANPDPHSKRYWAAAYLVPVFSNPAGWTYSPDLCNKLVHLARKYDILLIAEDVYNLLYFTDTEHAPPRMLSFDKTSDPDYGRGHVISNGTFSKFLAPSLRLGWIEGSPHMLSVLCECNLAGSGGCFNYYTSKLVTCILKTGTLHQHAKWLRETYKARMDALCDTLDKGLPKGCSYHKSQGGFFLWVTLLPGTDAFRFGQFVRQKYGVTFLPGICSSPTGNFSNCARLSISGNDEDTIKEAAKKLCQAYQDFLEAP